MYVVRDVQHLKDQVLAVEKDLTYSISDLRKETQRNFKLLLAIVVFEAFPTLQSLGVPTHELVPLLIKLIGL